MEIVTGQRGAAVAGMDDDRWFGRGIVGEKVMLGAPGERDVAGFSQTVPLVSPTMAAVPSV